MIKKFTLMTMTLLLMGACQQNRQHETDTNSDSVSQNSEPRTPVSFGEELPDYEFKTLNGDQIALSDYRGKVVIINFWATWCGPCRREIPELVEIQDEFRNDGLEIIGISLDEDGFEVVKPFLANFDINYTIVEDDYTYGNRLGGVYMLPTTYIIDRDGKMAFRKIGEVTRDELMPELEKHL